MRLMGLPLLSAAFIDRSAVDHVPIARPCSILFNYTILRDTKVGILVPS
jgi:hypothetical protein